MLVYRRYIKETNIETLKQICLKPIKQSKMSNYTVKTSFKKRKKKKILNKNEIR